MQGNVEQEGLHKNSKFHDGQGGSIISICICVKHLKNIFFNAIGSKLKLNAYMYI
jgi:hypothetical protein